MNDLNDDILNEYLDDTLAPARRREVETLLAESAEARQRLAALQDVFAALHGLEETPLARDLSAAVVQRIATTSVAPWARWLPAVQLAAAAAMAAWLWPALAAGWQAARFAAITAVSQFLSGYTWPASSLGEQLAAWGTAVFRQLQAAPPLLNVAPDQWGVLLAVAFLAWLAGNRLLLTIKDGGPSHG